MTPKILANLALCLSALCAIELQAASAQSQVQAWGLNTSGQCTVPAPPPGTHWTQVAAGWGFTAAVLDDGTILAWGSNSAGQLNAPPPPAGSRYVEVACGNNHALGRLDDGSVVAWGLNNFGQCSVPVLPPNVTFVEISVELGDWSLARCSDGSLRAWGDNSSGQCNVPAPPAGLTFVEIAAGQRHGLARLSDDTVVAWGLNTAGQCNVPVLPVGQMFVDVAAGQQHSLARVSDGTVVAWGSNAFGQCNVPAAPAGLSYTGIAAGAYHSLGRLSDGTIVAWGSNTAGQCNVPALPGGYACTGLAGGAGHSVALLDSLVNAVCFGDGSAAACPCANSGLAGHGCDNSAATGGALLGATGNPSLSADTLTLTSSGELPHPTSILLQGTTMVSALAFGDGLRCAGGQLKRLYVHNAVNGSVTMPQAGDLSISARSAALNQPIPVGALRLYQVYYRDPDANFCAAPTGSTFNVSNALSVLWGA